MSDQYKISEIHFEFDHENKDYIVFSTCNPRQVYLYFQHKSKNIRSLFYGQDFLENLSQLRNRKDVSCIECHLGTEILGGVSIDGENMIANNLSVEKANKILENVRQLRNGKLDFIQLF